MGRTSGGGLGTFFVEGREAWGRPSGGVRLFEMESGLLECPD